MSGKAPSPIATPLAQQIATDGKWDQASAAPGDEFDLLIEVHPGKADAAKDHVTGAGGTVKHSYGDVIFATARADQIVNIAHGAPIRKVQEDEAPRQHATTTSEGVTTTDADDLHALGITGSDITVAVIDLEFNKDQTEIKDQVIDTIGDSSYFTTSSAHGTACAEIVSEMLPDADLVLGTVYSYSFPNLMDKITNNHDPDVITMSLGYKPTLRLDGKDYLSDRIIEYTSASGANTSEGGLFAVSAGNEAYKDHFDRAWTDTSGNGYLEFDDSGTEFFELQVNSTDQDVVVQSDADWSTDQDFVLELYDGSKNLIKSFTKTSTPAQAITVSSTGTHYLKIKDDGLSGDEHLDLFTWLDIDFPTYTSERSLGIPATCPDPQTLSTAAVEHDSDNLERFSSRGPTQDGRRGVDIAGPDGTQSDTYSGEFYGTSAAAPHVAGVAGLLSTFGGPTNVDIREAIFRMARDNETDDDTISPPPNPKIGYGYAEAAAGMRALVGLVQRWATTTGGRAQFASPATDGTRVFAGGLQPELYALHRTDGSQAWSVARSGALADSSPTVAGGTVFVGSGGGTMYALNASDGKPVWSTSTDSAITSSPAVMNSTVFYGTNDGRVRARAVSDGTEAWTTSVGGPVYSAVAAASGLVFVTTADGVLVCLDGSSGNVEWQFDTGVELGASSPTIGGGSVLLGADAVYAFDVASTRTKQWTASYGGTAGSSPAYLNGSVFVGSADGSLYALDAATSGTQLWTAATGGAIAADPAAVGDRVLVPSMDGTLYAYLASDGTQLGTATLPSATRAAPLIADNDLYLGTDDGSFVSH